MTNRPRSPETGNDSGIDYDRDSATGIPRWAKVVAIVLAVVALLIVVVMLTGGPGEHNPGRHG